MRVIGAAIVTRGEKGGRKGAKRIMKVNTVVSARRRNKECWRESLVIGNGLATVADLPIDWA